MDARIMHLRRAVLPNGEVVLADKHTLKMLQLEPMTMGGITIARVQVEGEERVAIAYCRPDENFSKTIGRHTAIGRATKQREQEELLAAIEELSD